MVVSDIPNYQIIVMLILTPAFYFFLKVGPWGGRSLKLIGLGLLSPRWLLPHPGGFNHSLGPEGGLKCKAVDPSISALHLGRGLGLFYNGPPWV